MNHCLITYEACGSASYSARGLRQLSASLKTLNDFPYSAEFQRHEAVLRASKMSIQGVQPKLSVRLNVRAGVFEIVDRGGRFIIKPQHEFYPELPQNEAVTMGLARMVGIEVPVHGLVYGADRALSYFVRRFDRGRGGYKFATEDFAQLSGCDRETKYDSSMEKLADVLDRFCTFPAVEKVKLFMRCLFNFLVGNEDMHLKNFSLITRDGKVELSPAYDLLSTTIAFLALGKRIEDIEETALTLKGQKKRFTRSIWLDYYAGERLKLMPKVIDQCLDDFRTALPAWQSLVEICFLSDRQKQLFRDLLRRRSTALL